VQVLEISGLGRANAHGQWEGMAGGFAARADERTDHFLPPTGEEGNLTSATLLAPAPEGDFIFSARVEVEFAAAFDAGTLLLFFDSARWAKLCFEATPEVSPSVVSVVTRDRSDDANSSYPARPSVYLRIARIGEAYAFHSSADGGTWEFVRFFQLGDPGQIPQLGFSAQSPTGPGCHVRFTEVSFRRETLPDLRNGS